MKTKTLRLSKTETSTMKAAIHTAFGAPEVLQIKEIAKPTPKENELLIKVVSTSVTSGDARIRSMNIPFGFRFISKLMFGFSKPKHPIMGMNFAGVVKSIGSEVTNYKVGDEIFGSGNATYAEYIVVAESDPMAITPKNISLADASAIMFGSTSSLTYLKDFGKIQRGEKILIIGASGSLGTAAVQLAKYFGAEVTGVCSGKNVELVKSLGADFVIDYETEDFTKNDKKYDVIFETIGKTTFADCKKALTDRGRCLMAVAGVPDYFRMLLTTITGGKKVVAGVAMPSKKDVEILKDLVEAGHLKAVIDKRFSLAEIADAHRYVDSGRKRGNIVVTMHP